MNKYIFILTSFILILCIQVYGCQPINKKLLAEIHIDQGNAWLKYEDLSRDFNLFWNYHFNRGINFNVAIGYFTKALKIDPNNARAYLNRGFCCSLLNQPDRACKDFQKVCKSHMFL